MSLKFMAAFVILSLSISNAAKSKSDTADRQKFQAWKQKFSKVYASAGDEDRAMKNMLANLKEIEAHNALFKAGKVTFSRKTWEYSDLTFTDKLQALAGSKEGNSSQLLLQGGRENFKKGLEKIDWVKAGLVHPIQDQKKCGSCWSFTAVGVAEGFLLKKGIKTRLSPQKLVDCNKANLGCSGGDSFVALRYIRANGGLASLNDYPYTARDDRCKNTSGKVSVPFNAIKRERLNGDENRLKDIVSSVGPVAIAMNAAASFSNYEAGIYNNPKCSKSLNHAMLLVGYGYDNKTKLDYWLVRNSWGVTWGENGFVRMVRNKRNQCGIASEVVYILN